MKPPGLPPLTILGQEPGPPPPAAKRADRYGSFFYVALIGLVVLVGWVGLFALGVYRMRDVWARIAVLHDAARPDLERIQAARDLAADPRVNQRQLWDMAVRPQLPGPSRFLLAEAIRTEAVADDPRAYALAVAYSEGWPDWFRIQLLRPIAEAADDVDALPPEALVALSDRDDPAISALAFYIRAVALGDGPAAEALARAADRPDREASLAGFLDAARRLDPAARREALATLRGRIRTQHPATVELWRGLAERDGRIVAGPAPELLRGDPPGGVTPSADPPRH